MSDPVSSECVVADRAGLSGAREVAVAHGQHVLRGSGEHRDRVVVAEARDADDRLDWAVSARVNEPRPCSDVLSMAVWRSQ
jgi:hypothetical protein